MRRSTLLGKRYVTIREVAKVAGVSTATVSHAFDLDFVNERATNIRVDYLSGMRQVINHLYQLGHRRIGFVGGRRVLKNILLRHESYVVTMRELGLEPGPIVIGNQSLDGGYSAG